MKDKEKKKLLLKDIYKNSRTEGFGEEVKRRIVEAKKEDNEFVFNSEAPIIKLDEADVIEEVEQNGN